MNPADGYSVLLVKSLRQGTGEPPGDFLGRRQRCWSAFGAGAGVGLLAEALVTGMEAAVQTVRAVPVIGLIAQVALLATLAHTVGLSVTGWSVGMLCALTTNAILTRALARSRATAFGPANWVTLARSTVVAGVAALIAEAFVQAAPMTAVVMLTVIALVLDTVDGRVARRTASATAVGARFDMEVDAFLILVLSAYVAQSVGLWVLTIGAARYAFVAAGWLLPWLRESPPPRYWYKFVAALQGIVLTIVIADILPGPGNVAALTLALVLLGESFGHEVWWLWQHGRIQARRPVEGRRIVLISAEPRAAVG
jgi:phosphatidylglycerophosphate synthase